VYADRLDVDKTGEAYALAAEGRAGLRGLDGGGSISTTRIWRGSKRTSDGALASQVDLAAS